VISAGNSRLSLDCGNLAVCDKSGSGYKLLGGYKIGNLTSIGLSWDSTKSTVSIAGGSDSGNVHTFGIGVTFGF
jgi:hypothetical protein